MTTKIKLSLLLLIAGLSVTVMNGCKKDDAPPVPPTVTTADVTDITFNSATTGGTITSNGGAAITTSGICWSKENAMPTLSDTVVSSTTTTGSFTSIIENLEDGAAYYVRAFATNNVGTGYGNVITFNTFEDTTKVTFTYNGEEVTYGVIVSSVTGRKWMDRNLGASQVATSVDDIEAYGDLFQWGRLDDGHQVRSSGYTQTLSSSDVPDHANFIATMDPATFYDWRNPQNNNLWQGSQGINNPCPEGWHVPTKEEWEAETGITNGSTAFSQLKLTVAGYRWVGNIIADVDTYGRYWTSTTTVENAFLFRFNADAMEILSNNRANGLSVRCIKD